MLIDITNFNFECGDKGGSVLIDFNFACDCNNNGGTETYNLELNLKDFGHGYGSFKLNGTTYSPTKTPYKLNFTDELTSFSLNTSNVTEIISFPNTSKVKSLNSVFSYSPITNIDLRDWDLSSIEDVDFAFSYMQNCKSIKFNTDILKDKTSAQGLFGGCYSLETVYKDVPSNGVALSGSTSGITNANYMFYGCKKIKSVNLDTSNITNANGMFQGCSSLTSINGGKWNSVTDASYMFANCSSLDMNFFKTNYVFWQDLIGSSCTSMESMFRNCNFNGENANLPYWNVSNVINMQHLFENSNLGDFTIPNGWVWSNCISFYKMFANNPMQTISLQYGHWGNAKNFSYMFDGCSNLTSVDFRNGYDLTGVTNVEGMFNGCTSLQEVYCSDCDAYNIIKKGLESSGFDSSIIKGCDCGDSGDSVSGYSVLSFIINDYTSASYRINGNSQNFSSSDENVLYSASTEDMKNMVGGEITSLEFVGGIKQFVAIPPISTLNGLDIYYNSVDLIDLSKTNLNNLTRFHLYSCSNLKHIDLSNWTSFNVSDYDFFSNCSNLKSVKMLNCCEEAKQFVRDRLSENGINAVVITEENNTYLSLDYIYTPIWYRINGVGYTTESNVTDLSNQLYDGCSVNDMLGRTSYLKTVYTMPSLSGTTGHWDMFKECSGLLYQDLSTWDFDFINGNQDIQNFFNGSSSLVWVNFSGWDLTNASNVESMFTSCEKLKYVFAYGCNEETISKLQQAIDNSGYSINLVH